jgi:molybdenum cofactor cytidylyltransferase
MTQYNDITALVLAAGFSSRMKRFKPLLPLGRMTALERCVNLFRDAGVNDVRVVVGYRADELIPILDGRHIRWIMNDRFQEGMFSSVQAGVRDLESAFFLLPVDMPLVRRTTVSDVLTARSGQPADVWIPSFSGKRGHPPLISTIHRSDLLQWNGDGGLRAFLNERALHIVEVEVADEHTLIDMDSPEHYEAAVAAPADYDIPSVRECVALLEQKFQMNGRIRAHSDKVAEVALSLAKALNKKGCGLNLKLIVAAALLHDLAKGSPNHAAVAAEALTELGYPTVAEVHRSHMDTRPLFNQPISPHEVVCFADKLVQEDRIVPIEARFRAKLDSVRQDPHLVDTISRRLSNILGIRDRLAQALGAPVESVLVSACADCAEDEREGEDAEGNALSS